MHQPNQIDFFELNLQLPTSELIWEFESAEHLAFAEIDFLINPRRTRGSDFQMRWAQGRWSEEIAIRALNQTAQFGVLPYGPSIIEPEDPAEREQFYEKMRPIFQEGKRPDLLLYDKLTYEWARDEVERHLGTVEQMAAASSVHLRDVVAKAKAALEIENSLWVTEKMPGFGKPFSRYKRGKNKGRLKPAGIVPNIWIKQEDISPLQRWEAEHKIAVHIVQIFYDRGYFIKFNDVLDLLEAGELGMETESYTNPSGRASSPKQVVRVPYILCKEFGTVSGPTLEPRAIVDKNGKVMTYVTFSGGEIQLSSAVFKEWG